MSYFHPKLDEIISEYKTFQKWMEIGPPFLEPEHASIAV